MSYKLSDFVAGIIINSVETCTKRGARLSDVDQQCSGRNITVSSYLRYLSFCSGTGLGDVRMISWRYDHSNVNLWAGLSFDTVRFPR